jgi:hypothetical protein
MARHKTRHPPPSLRRPVTNPQCKRATALRSARVLLYKNVIYLVEGGGIPTTLNAETGVKQERLKDALDSYFSRNR